MRFAKRRAPSPISPRSKDKKELLSASRRFSQLPANRGVHHDHQYCALQPIVALVAGILILIIPRLLNIIVAIYLILIGLLGLGLFR
jgi:hypothetical protein